MIDSQPKYILLSWCMLRNASFVITLAFICINPCLSQNAANYYSDGLKLANTGAIDDAVDALDDALILDPDYVDALFLRAYLYLDQKEIPKALADYSKILSINPMHAGARSNRALIFMEMENYEDALSDLDLRLRNNPNDPTAIFERSYCYGLMGEHAKAITGFTEVLRIDPDNPSAMANRGFSKINDLTKDGLVQPTETELMDACSDLKKAESLGDNTVTEMINRYCKADK